MEPADNHLSTHEVAQKDPGCVVCANLRRALTTRGFLVTLGPIGEIISRSSCPGHAPLFRFIRDDHYNRIAAIYQNETDGEVHLETDELEGSQDDQRELLLYEVSLSRHDDSPHTTILVEPSPRTGHMQIWTTVLARCENEDQIAGYGRVLDNYWIDLDIVKGWKQECFSLHGEKCHNPLHIKPVSPAWLIDTSGNSLVPGDDISDYVALSYRWGTSAGFRATRSSLDDLRQPGGLSPGNVELPVIIRHAMQLVEALGERYLWVDAVCIVQDDKVHFTEQLQLMGAIYSTASITIVAADGDAEDGLRGLKGISSSRNLAQKVIPVFDNEKVIIRQEPNFWTTSGCDEYFERGWTYQEYYLSKRRLIFSTNQIYWQCTSHYWSEDIIRTDVAEGHHKYFGELSALMCGVPKYDLVGRRLQEYDARKFSYPEDALPGITGFLAILNRSFPGGFLFGLAESCFDSLLLWDCAFPSDMDRREDCRKIDPLGSAYRLPSWSWIGWRMFGLRFPDEETFELAKTGNRTIPITEWYTHETPDAVVKRRIESSWFNLRTHAGEAHLQPADGWTRERYDENEHGELRGAQRNGKPPEGLGEYVYRHSAVPGKAFWLPVPVTPLDDNITPLSTPQTPFISCETARGWFMASRFPDSWFSDDVPGSRYEERFFNMRLLDANREYCGELKLNREEDKDNFVEADSDCTPGVVELVAICQRRSPEVGSRDKMHVLWVEWADGVAYRKAVGFVWLDAWQRHELENVHLVLG